MIAHALLLTLALGFQNENPWVPVVSQEGQFTIAFPGKPTSTQSTTRNGPGGRLQVLLIECETPSVDYVIQKITLPTAVVRGAEMNQLNFFRDEFVKEFHGKIITEKRVNREGKPGLDFTVRVQEGRGGPIVTIRVREYLIGQAIFRLYAIAAANRELPSDSGKFFGSFGLGTNPIKKGGPKPEPTGTPVPGWGLAVKDDDCKIAPDGKALVIEMPGTLHDLNADIDQFNAPRVLQEVQGDFLAEVKVVGEFQPGAKSMNPKSVPYNGAGLFVWRDSENFIRLERAAILRNGKLGTFALFEEREGGSTGAMHNGNLTPGTTYFRLARRGGRVFAFTSKDGKNWLQLRPIDIEWPSKLKVGVIGINSSDAPFKIRFEDYSLKGKVVQSGQP